jgi:putative serine/threonine protein kinase
LKPPKTIPVEELLKEPYASVVCYPRSTPSEMQDRIKELQQHGVSEVEFVGKTSAANIPVLGKGYVGVVVVALLKGKRIALKMRRVDADRESLEHEAELLSKANSVNVGPKFLAVSKNFLLMQLIGGDLLEDYLQTHNDKALIRKVLVDILEQCWRLDEAGLDHGELSKAPKHLLVDKTNKSFIVDFETASTNRNASNVTSVCQYLYQSNSQACRVIAETLGKRDRAKLVNALKRYKKDRSKANFNNLLGLCLS